MVVESFGMAFVAIFLHDLAYDVHDAAATEIRTFFRCFLDRSGYLLFRLLSWF